MCKMGPSPTFDGGTREEVESEWFREVDGVPLDRGISLLLDSKNGKADVLSVAACRKVATAPHKHSHGRRNVYLVSVAGYVRIMPDPKYVFAAAVLDQHVPRLVTQRKLLQEIGRMWSEANNIL